jgi:WD40 repeat protein
MASGLPLQLTLLSPLTSPSLSRAWQTAIHPTKPIVATCSSDKNVRVYSLTSFTLLSTISGGHKRSVRSVAWKPGTIGESTLATGSFDASVGVWRRDDEQRDNEEKDFTGGGVDDDNKDEDEEWRFALVLDGHDSEVKSVAWSAGGNFLATCSRDKSIWIWEEVAEDDFETIAVLQEHQGDVKCVVWHPEEELLASASYDDDIRLWREDVDDWTCIAILSGHKSTVWMVEWEGTRMPTLNGGDSAQPTPEQDLWIKRRERTGPRLASCSDDLTIRLWRKVPKENNIAQNPLSIIRSGSIEEEWIEELQLPKRHDLAIYSISWSKKTGRIVSTGGDGKVVVYEERWKSAGSAAPQTNPHPEANAEAMEGVEESSKTEAAIAETEWVVVAEVESSHGVFEVNHAIWARRWDTGKSSDEEEMIISTGDDGVVKLWTLGNA